MHTIRSIVVGAALAVTLCAVAAGPARADEVPEPAATAAPTPEPEPPVVEPPATAVPVAASALPLRAGAHGWRVRVLQDRLAWLGYPISASNRTQQQMGASTVAAVRKAQAKFGYRPTGVVGPGTWELVRDRAGTVGRLPAGCRTGRVVCVDKTARLVRLVVDGDVGTTLDARFGFPGAATREGTFHVSRKSRYHVSSLYRTSMPFSLFFSGGQAVHYSPYFARDGYSGASHGCVNLRDYDGARWLFDHVPLGTRVYVYWS